MSKKTEQPKFFLQPELVLFLGIIVCAFGAYYYYTTKHSESKTITAADYAPPTIMDRKLAIQQALKEGKKEYSFTTNYIPGIGQINDPQAYLNQQEENAKKQLNSKN